MTRRIDATTAWLGCILRGPRPAAAAAAPSPAARVAKLTLYEFEASPWCRRVRECAETLGLPLRIRPCPRETVMAEGVFTAKSAFRGVAQTAGGRVLFPLLVDEGADGATLYQSGDVVAHLWRVYGPAGSQEAGAAAAAPPSIVTTALLAAPSAMRPHRGVMRWSHLPGPAQPLELWACEGCWRSVLVREALCELELEYIPWPGTTPPRLHDPNLFLSCNPDGGKLVVACSGHERPRLELDGHETVLTHLTTHYATGPRPGWLSLLATVPDENLGARVEAEVWMARMMQRLLRTIDFWVRGKKSLR